jgi:hypothetical protein
MEGRLDDMRHLAHLSPLDPGYGIEIHPQLVRMLEVFGAHRVRVQLDTGEVGKPGERGWVTRYHLISAAARGKAQ